jgi:hypothetical protein
LERLRSTVIPGTRAETAAAIEQAKSATSSCVYPETSGTKTWMPRLPEVLGTLGSCSSSNRRRITPAASMACSIPLPLAGSRSKRIQSGSSRLSVREDHMCVVSTDICASQRRASRLSTTRCRALPLLVVRVGVSTIVSQSGPSLPMFWWNHDGLSMPWFQCSSASGRSLRTRSIGSATAS